MTCHYIRVLHTPLNNSSVDKNCTSYIIHLQPSQLVLNIYLALYICNITQYSFSEKKAIRGAKEGAKEENDTIDIF